MKRHINCKLRWIIPLFVIVFAVIPSAAQLTGKSLRILRQAGRIPETSSFVSAALPMDLAAMVERRAIYSQAHVSGVQNFQEIQNLSLQRIWAYGGSSALYGLLEDKTSRVDPLLARLPDNTAYIPVEGVSLSPLYEDRAMQNLWVDLAGERGLGPQKVLLAASACKKVDQFLFMEKDGQVFLNVPVMKHFHSYEIALEGAARTLQSLVQYPLFTRSVENFFVRRNKQIASSIEKYLNNSGDITTQRTAEEIKQLVDNLDSRNPLRISVEAALRMTAREGHISPVVDLER